jgi:hypothetical protein
VTPRVKRTVNSRLTMGRGCTKGGNMYVCSLARGLDCLILNCGSTIPASLLPSRDLQRSLQ